MTNHTMQSLADEIDGLRTATATGLAEARDLLQNQHEIITSNIKVIGDMASAIERLTNIVNDLHDDVMKLKQGKSNE